MTLNKLFQLGASLLSREFDSLSVTEPTLGEGNRSQCLWGSNTELWAIGFLGLGLPYLLGWAWRIYLVNSHCVHATIYFFCHATVKMIFPIIIQLRLF